MTAPNWYATELLIEEQKREIERAARTASPRHRSHSGPRVRRFGRRH